MLLDHIVVKMLRAAGLHERADAVERANSVEAAPARRENGEVEEDYSPPGAPSEPAPHPYMRDDDHAPSGHTGGGASAAVAGEPAVQYTAAEVGSHSSSDVERGGRADEGGGGSAEPATAEAAADRDGHSSAHAISLGGIGPDRLPEHHKREELDPHDPMAGLYSNRLRDSLSREAFRTASTEAQDSAIVERVLPPNLTAFREAGERTEFPSPMPLEEWRASRGAAIAALDGEIPNFARGNQELDPSLIRQGDGPTSVRDADATRSLASSGTLQRNRIQELDR